MQNENKVIVITGATSGIGLAAAKELAGRGAFVIATGRNEDRCRNAEQEIRSLCPDAKIFYIAADLSSLSEVSSLAQSVRTKLAEEGISHLDALINNAGTVSSWYISTVDGFELQFAVNHLAPFKLTAELLPLLQLSSAGTVISVSSGSHYRTKMHWQDILLRKHYSPLLAYKQTKLANVLFIQELTRRLKHHGSTIRAYAVDPGLVNTEIGLKGTSGIVQRVWRLRSRRGTSTEIPAGCIAWLALDDAPRRTDMLYWKDRAPLKPSRYSENEAHGARLWALSEKMCGLDSFLRIR